MCVCVCTCVCMILSMCIYDCNFWPSKLLLVRRWLSRVPVRLMYFCDLKIVDNLLKFSFVDLRRDGVRVQVLYVLYPIMLIFLPNCTIIKISVREFSGTIFCTHPHMAVYECVSCFRECVGGRIVLPFCNIRHACLVTPCWEFSCFNYIHDDL